MIDLVGLDYHRLRFRGWTGLTSVLLWAAGAAAQTVPDFAHPGSPHTMGKNPFAPPTALDQYQQVKPRTGLMPLLVILLEFPDSAHLPENTVTTTTDLVFGSTPSVHGYYQDVSYRQFGFRNAGVVGWYRAPQSVNAYFGPTQTLYNTVCAEAIRAASGAGYNFRQWDTNGNGKVTQDELVILVIVADHPPIGLPQMMGTRFDHGSGQGVRTGDGVDVDTFAVRVEENLYGANRVRVAGKFTYVSYYAHELGHAALSLPDLYADTFGEDPSDFFTIMATAGLTVQPHLDPWAKIHLGWIRPVVVRSSGWYTIRQTETNAEAYILYNPARGPNEYFILENRRPSASPYGAPNDFPDRGLAIWHITEFQDNQPFDFLRGRKMIGMKWAQGAASVDREPFHALWDGADPLASHDFSDTATPRNARWADGSLSGIAIRNIPPAGPEMRVYIEIGPTGAGPTPVVVKNSASYTPDSVLAPDMIAYAQAPGIGRGLVVASTTPWPETLDGVRLEITDSRNQVRMAPIYYVATDAISFLVPPGTALGPATLRLTNSTTLLRGTVDIQRVSPGIYSAASSGAGVAAAFFLRAGADGTRTQDYVFSPGALTAVPVDLGAAGDQVYLLLFGTGFRGHNGGVTATVGGAAVPVLGAVPQGQFQGLDQVNIGPLPRSLAGRGEVGIVLTVDGKVSNTVTVRIR